MQSFSGQQLKIHRGKRHTGRTIISITLRKTSTKQITPSSFVRFPIAFDQTKMYVSIQSERSISASNGSCPKEIPLLTKSGRPPFSDKQLTDIIKKAIQGFRTAFKTQQDETRAAANIAKKREDRIKQRRGVVSSIFRNQTLGSPLPSSWPGIDMKDWIWCARHIRN
jgi:hypothetical protein